MNNDQWFIITFIVTLSISIPLLVIFEIKFASQPVYFNQWNSTQVYSKPCMGGTTAYILYCLNQHIQALESRSNR